MILQAFELFCLYHEIAVEFRVLNFERLVQLVTVLSTMNRFRHHKKWRRRKRFFYRPNTCNDEPLPLVPWDAPNYHPMNYLSYYKYFTRNAFYSWWAPMSRMTIDDDYSCLKSIHHRRNNVTLYYMRTPRMLILSRVHWHSVYCEPVCTNYIYTGC